MARIKWEGSGVFRDGQSGVVAGPGPGRPLVHEVDEETARRFLDAGHGWVRLDEDQTDDETADDSDEVGQVAPEDFDAVAFVDRTPMGDVIADLESGAYDTYLDAIEAAEAEHRDRDGVADAIADRRET